MKISLTWFIVIALIGIMLLVGSVGQDQTAGILLLGGVLGGVFLLTRNKKKVS